jgi:sugar/nucleoside kinase (ribokinase family)
MTTLLIAGGLTVDRFPDGRRAPGGSVLHAGLAAAAEGAEITTLTVAGDEPEARDGLARLAALGDVIGQPADATTTYRHEERDGRRVLIYEAAGGMVDPRRVRTEVPPDVLLAAPIAGELPAAVLSAMREAVRPRLTVLLIQGWLRRLELGAEVHPLPLSHVPEPLWAAFAEADAVVVSTEDLAEVPADPFVQAADLRARIGAGPLLVVTLGDRGHLLDDPAADRLAASVPRRVVDGVPAVGAGDTFGAALAVGLAQGLGPVAAADAATERVIRMLEARRSGAA